MAELYTYIGATGAGGQFEFKVTDIYSYRGEDTYLDEMEYFGLYSCSSIYDFRQVAEIDSITQVNSRRCFILGKLLGGDNGLNSCDLVYRKTNGSILEEAAEVTTIYGQASGTTPTPDTTDTSAAWPGYVSTPDDFRINSVTSYTISTNIPIFKTASVALLYLRLGWDDAYKDDCVNYYNPEYEQDTTETYFFENKIQTVTQLRGNVTPTGDITYRSTIFMANTRPAMYFDDDYTLHLLAPDVVAGYSLPSPWSVLEKVPETSWNNESIGYTGVYYGNMGYRGELPPDGTYTYGIYVRTNITIHKSQAAAQHAIDTGDYSDAINYSSIIENGISRPPSIGVAETSTTYGPGGFASPFVSQYVMGLSGVRDVSSIFFTDDSTLLDNIKRGLELFGAKPVDAIMSLVAFPFDVSTMTTCSDEYGIWFGSYRHKVTTPVKKIGSFTGTNSYLDCGSVLLKPIFYNYRDYKDITLSVYLPFIGWQDLQIEKYVNKTVNVRYYVDINTRQCAAVLAVSDSEMSNVMSDYFIGEIGVVLPIVGSNFADYARSEIQHLSKTASGMLNPLSFDALSNIINAGASVPGGSMSGMQNTGIANYGLYKFGQNGSPKDIQMTKGSFSSGLGMYLPQYVMFRYDYHEVAEPGLLNQLAGKPSTACGKISGFSGFLSGRVSKLVTSGMTDMEIQELMNAIMNDGIYI